MIRKISCWRKLGMLFNFFVYFFQNKIWQKKNFQIKKFPQIFLLYILNIKIDCVYNFEFDSIEKFSFKSIQHNSFYFNKYHFQLIKQFLFEKVSKKGRNLWPRQFVRILQRTWKTPQRRIKLNSIFGVEVLLTLLLFIIFTL